ncbi:glycosyltransferase family 4 protein [Polaribacter sp. OB-PA-B3]
MSKKVLYIGNNNTKNETTLKILSDCLRIEGFDIIITSNKQNKFLRLLDMCLNLLKLGFKLDYVIIDTYSTTNFYYALICSQICRILKIKYIPILHGGDLPNRLKKNEFISSLIFNNSHINVSPSLYLKKEFERCNFKVDVIPNIIKIDKYPFLKRNNIKPKLLFVRAFHEIYNPEMALNVLKEVLKSFSEATLCMIGPIKDNSHQNFLKLASQYNLIDKIEITGFLAKEEWHKKSKEFDIFINTSNFDNMPVSIIEAMALGLPIVSTNVGGIPYLIEDDIDGLLVDKKDVKAMAKAVNLIVEGKHQDLAINARKKVESFSWNSVRKKWLEILK